MIIFIGYFLAFGSVFGAYFLHGGNIGVLLNALPLELMIIGGAAIGSFVVCNQPKILKATFSSIVSSLQPTKYTKRKFMLLLTLLYKVFQKIRKEGFMSIEADIENPKNSTIFRNYPEILNSPELMKFILDYLRIILMGKLKPHEIESLMDSEISANHQELNRPVMALQRLAGSLPAFGIVAAVLGVINTMGSVGQAPAILGAMIASALVGTFLGILLAYALVEPLAGLIEQNAQDSTQALECIKSTLIANMQGYSPATSVEFGRKVLFSTERPEFVELERYLKSRK